MYLPKSKYTVKAAKAGEYTYKGKPYVGPYIETYNGFRFPGKDVADVKDMTQLIAAGEFYGGPVKSALDDDTIKITPTEDDYKTGSFTRYFQKDKRSGAIRELTEDQFYERGKKLKYYTTGSCKWIIKGTLDDYMVGKYPVKGVKSKNQETLDRLEDTLPGIKLYVTDSGQFVSGTLNLQ